MGEAILTRRNISKTTATDSLTKMDKKAEISVSEYKKLALRYKTLEAQLRQSVPKKEHHEAVTKLEKEVDGLEKELERTKADLQKYNAFSKQLGSIDDQIVTTGKVAMAVNRAIDSLSFKISQGCVPTSVHVQALTRSRELEEQVRGMVSKAEYSSLQKRYEDVSRQAESMVSGGEYSMLKQRFEDISRAMGSMVPGSEFNALKQRNEELENTLSAMVPRAQLESSEARIGELEGRLAEQVPQSVYDELVSKVVSLAEEVTGGSRSPESTESTAQPEAEAEAQTVGADGEPNGDFIEEPTGPEFTEPEATEVEPPAPEITEVQSQLVEISSVQNEAPIESPVKAEPSPALAPKPQASPEQPAATSGTA